MEHWGRKTNSADSGQKKMDMTALSLAVSLSFAQMLMPFRFLRANSGEATKRTRSVPKRGGAGQPSNETTLTQQWKPFGFPASAKNPHPCDYIPSVPAMRSEQFPKATKEECGTLSVFRDSGPDGTIVSSLKRIIHRHPTAHFMQTCMRCSQPGTHESQPSSHERGLVGMAPVL